MKIRTDFVTNSSSYSSAEVVIDNPILLEILQKYREMGMYTWGKPCYEFGSYGTDTRPRVREIQTPAFFYSTDDNFYHLKPETLSEVLECLIEIMDDDDDVEYDVVLFERMKEELNNRKNEITGGFRTVKWRIHDTSNEHEFRYNGYIEEESIFSFDHTKGEEFLCITYTGNGSDDKMDADVILERKQILNGEIINTPFIKGEQYHNEDFTEDEFVSNYNCNNIVEVIIANPILLEILQKYKDIGLFGNKKPIIGIGTYESIHANDHPSFLGGRVPNPAFYNYETGDDDTEISALRLSYGPPASLVQVLGYITSFMEKGAYYQYLNSDVFTQLHAELYQRRKEINSNYQEVYWKKQQIGDGYNHVYLFTYDPIKGVSYNKEDLWIEGEEQVSEE